MTPRSFAASALVLLTAGLAAASQLTTTKGQVLTGEVRAASDQLVIFDTVLDGERVSLRVPRDQIKELKEGPVPADFFAGARAEPRRSKPGDFTPDQRLYLELTLKGRFGHEVFAQGVERVLSYAKRHRIGHLVIHLDMGQSSGSPEARRVFDLLGQHRAHLQLHAIVRQGLGDALAVLLQCHSVHVLPGGKIGGAASAASSDEEAVRRRSLARAVGRAAAARGGSALLAEAMVAPEVEVSLLRAGERVQILGGAPPAGTKPEQVLLHDGPESLLVLEQAHLAALGVPILEREGAAALGESLGIAWKRESDYADELMQRVTADERRAARSKERVYARRCANLQRKRKSVASQLEHELRLAASWDPSGGSYQTIKKAGYWDWNSATSGPAIDTGVLTRESRRTWRERTDRSLHYNLKARQAAKALLKLEQEAGELGLEPLVEQDRLQRVVAELRGKAEHLRSERNKKEE